MVKEMVEPLIRLCNPLGLRLLKKKCFIYNH